MNTKTDVFSDILNGPRYQGTVDSLRGVTSVVDNIFMWFISISAFFIISSALLKNVVAGVYASYPRLFDKIHDAKMFAVDGVRSRLGTLGSVAAFVLSLLPDFKEMSEFVDDTVQPKDYFLKAIPQMFCAVMIGVVIYNGYYRDIVVKVAQFGSTMIERILFKVDPVQVFDNLTNSFGTPTLSSDASDDSKSELISDLTKDIYAKTISFYTDITSPASKTALAANLEGWVQSHIETVSQYTDDKYYDASFQVDRVLGEVSLAGVDKDTDETIVRGWLVPYADFKIDSAEHKTEDWRLRVIVKFEKKHSGVASTGTITNAQLQVPAAAKKASSEGTYEIIALSSADMTGLSASKSGMKVGGISAELTNEGIKVYGKLGTSSENTYDVSGLWYADAKSPSNTVKSIKFTGSSVQYVDVDGKATPWKPGETAFSAAEKENNAFNNGSSGGDKKANSGSGSKNNTNSTAGSSTTKKAN